MSLFGLDNKLQPLTPTPTPHTKNSPLTPYYQNSHAEISIQPGAIFSYYINTTLILKLLKNDDAVFTRI